MMLVAIQCDKCKATSDATADKGETKRENLREQGWVYKMDDGERKDICPACRPTLVTRTTRFLPQQRCGEPTESLKYGPQRCTKSFGHRGHHQYERRRDARKEANGHSG